MRFKGMIAASALALLCQTEAADAKPLSSQKEKASYGIGLNVGARFKHDLIELDVDAFVRGFRDCLAGTTPAISKEEVEAAINALNKELEQKMSQAGERAKTEGVKFLEENKKAKGVTTTASGLQYQVIKEGTGPKPKVDDEVKVHYKGTLLDGTVFDSSYERNEPVTFPLGQVIKGWVEGLQLMKVGSKYKFFIPANLAYAEQGQGKIPANSTLVFEVELLGIETGAKQ